MKPTTRTGEVVDLGGKGCIGEHCLYNMYVGYLGLSIGLGERSNILDKV